MRADYVAREMIDSLTMKSLIFLTIDIVKCRYIIGCVKSLGFLSQQKSLKLDFLYKSVNNL